MSLNKSEEAGGMEIHGRGLGYLIEERERAHTAEGKIFCFVQKEGSLSSVAKITARRTVHMKLI